MSSHDARHRSIRYAILSRYGLVGKDVWRLGSLGLLMLIIALGGPLLYQSWRHASNAPILPANNILATAFKFGPDYHQYWWAVTCFLIGLVSTSDETDTNTWPLLSALPVSHRSICATKLITALLISLLLGALLAIGMAVLAPMQVTHAPEQTPQRILLEIWNRQLGSSLGIAELVNLPIRLPGSNLWLSAALLLSGAAAGTWCRSALEAAAVGVIAPFGTLVAVHWLLPKAALQIRDDMSEPILGALVISYILVAILVYVAGAVRALKSSHGSANASGTTESLSRGLQTFISALPQWRNGWANLNVNARALQWPTIAGIVFLILPRWLITDSGIDTFVILPFMVALGIGLCAWHEVERNGLTFFVAHLPIKPDTIFLSRTAALFKSVCILFSIHAVYDLVSYGPTPGRYTMILYFTRVAFLFFGMQGVALLGSYARQLHRSAVLCSFLLLIPCAVTLVKFAFVCLKDPFADALENAYAYPNGTSIDGNSPVQLNAFIIGALSSRIVMLLWTTSMGVTIPFLVSYIAFCKSPLRQENAVSRPGTLVVTTGIIMGLLILCADVNPCHLIIGLWPQLLISTH